MSFIPVFVLYLQFSQMIIELLQIKTRQPSVSRLRKFLRIYGEIWTKTTQTNWHHGRRLCSVNFRGFDLSPGERLEGQRRTKYRDKLGVNPDQVRTELQWCSNHQAAHRAIPTPPCLLCSGVWSWLTSTNILMSQTRLNITASSNWYSWLIPSSEITKHTLL